MSTDNAFIFDTHAHYDDEVFQSSLDTLIPEMEKAGVKKIITCGCNLKSSINAIKLAEKYDIVYAAVGIHPGNIDDGEELLEIEKLLNHEKCVAVGEIGLDYYWRQDNKNKQIEIFKKQLELANKHNLPVLVHDRDAHADTLEILKEFKPKGVVHAFSGSVEMARELLKIGLYLGVGGVLTFKNARNLPAVVLDTPLERLLLETDAPYLAPVPFRGKENRSDLIHLVAEKMAEIKGISKNEVLKTTFNNAENLFKKQYKHPTDTNNNCESGVF